MFWLILYPPTMPERLKYLTWMGVKQLVNRCILIREVLIISVSAQLTRLSCTSRADSDYLVLLITFIPDFQGSSRPTRGRGRAAWLCGTSSPPSSGSGGTSPPSAETPSEWLSWATARAPPSSTCSCSPTPPQVRQDTTQNPGLISENIIRK